MDDEVIQLRIPSDLLTAAGVLAAEDEVTVNEFIVGLIQEAVDEAR